MEKSKERSAPNCDCRVEGSIEERRTCSVVCRAFVRRLESVYGVVGVVRGALGCIYGVYGVYICTTGIYRCK